MTGFPVAFSIAGAGVISFAIIAGLDSAGLLIHQAIDTRLGIPSPGGRRGGARIRYPCSDTRTYRASKKPVFPGGWQLAMERNISFIVNRMNERVIAGQSIETLLAVADVRDDGHHA
jgi:hypothetical protein